MVGLKSGFSHPALAPRDTGNRYVVQQGINAAIRGLGQVKAIEKVLTFKEFINKNYPGYQWYRHCEVLVSVLQDVADGKRKRVMVFMPPRSGKSLIASRLFPAYMLYRFPTDFVAIASYAAELAYTFSRGARSAFLEADGVLADDAKSVKQWETQKGGGLWAAGVGGSATGKGFGGPSGNGVGVIDDPLKNAEDAGSGVIREKQKDWYSSTFYTRAAPNASILVIMTRWHEEDLSGWLLTQENEEPEHWHIVNFEAIKTDSPIVFPPTCTVEPDWRSPGEALCPERYNERHLAKIRSKLGEYFFAALYQQNPVPLGGSIIKQGWFKYYGTAPAKPEKIIQSWDTANKASELSAYSVCTTWAVTSTGYYLLHVWRDRVDAPDLLKTALNLAATWKPSVVLIEDKASGTGLIQHLQKQSRLSVIAIEPSGDKVTRLSIESPAIESGRVFLPEVAEWLLEYEKEMTSAPNGAFFDQNDSTSQFLAYMREKGGKTAMDYL
jgi:predicted phage terminase large subunit-like protein